MSPITDPVLLTFQNTAFKTVRDALFATFGKFPIRLEKDVHLQALQAMANMAKASGDGDTPFVQLIQHLHKYGLIEVVEK